METKIRQFRQDIGMTQQELADQLNVTDRAVSHWENGRRLPDYSLLKQLCDVLGISINELFASERIAKEDYLMKADENLGKLIDENNYKNQLIKGLIKGIITGIIVFIVVYIIINLCRHYH